MFPRSNRFGLLLAMLPAMFIFSQTASANSLPPACVSATLFDYEHNLANQQCSIGILIFQGFTFSASGKSVSNNVPAPTPDTDQQILLTPSTGGFMLSQVNGQQFSVLSGQIVNYNMGYQFVIDPAPVLEGAELGLDPPFGNVTVTQSYCNDSVFLSPSQCIAAKDNTFVTFAPQVLLVHNPDKLDDKITFNPPAFAFGSVNTAIVLDGTTGSAGFDATTGSSTVINVATTPEPSTVTLGCGALLLAFSRKYRKRQA